MVHILWAGVALGAILFARIVFLAEDSFFGTIVAFIAVGGFVADVLYIAFVRPLTDDIA